MTRNLVYICIIKDGRRRTKRKKIQVVGSIIHKFEWCDCIHTADLLFHFQDLRKAQPKEVKCSKQQFYTIRRDIVSMDLEHFNAN